ncbi:MAG TPA: M15 family metallopeptidase [Candidatus Mediterraneibacter cottocaccae]|nr:M15 family metallopeptidase [Candidatus Mediterraneibacter cottocaccae]
MERSDWNYLILVNRENPLRRFPDADMLESVLEEYPDVLMEHRAARALQALLEAIGNRGEIIPVSGFRTQAEQQKIWDDTLLERGEEFTRKFVAYPGCSEHQTGLAIDLGANLPEIDFICPEFPDTGIFGKFREKAADFGFIERYPKGKEAVTGIGAEPWHFRYVGVPHAAVMKAGGLVLEEYAEERNAFGGGVK